MSAPRASVVHKVVFTSEAAAPPAPPGVLSPASIVADKVEPALVPPPAVPSTEAVAEDAGAVRPPAEVQALWVARARHQYTLRGLQPGDAYYVVPTKWWDKWVAATGYTSAMEGSAAEASVPPPAATSGDDPTSALTPIDTTALVRSVADGGLEDVAAPDSPGGPSGPSVVVRGAHIGMHYHLLGEEVWKLLHAWYGGGPVLRRVVRLHPDSKQAKVAVHPEVEDGRASATGPAAGAGGAHDSDSDEGPAAGADAMLGRGVAVLPISVGPKDCHVCGKPSKQSCGRCKQVKYCGRACQIAHWKVHKPVCAGGKPSSRYGLVGLDNIGNTCFMAAALQCLSATWPLTSFFLSDAWKKELNKDNVLGSGGKVATAYASVVNSLWFGAARSVAPAALKRAIAAKNDRFTGFGQQDSQELLSFLLDELHEDLNRVLKKEYVEDLEAGSLPHDVAARLAWDRHLVRNSSVVMDHMFGQLRSRLVCPVEGCGRVSVTFDPIQLVSLPLPYKRRRQFKVYLSPAPSRIPPPKGIAADAAATQLVQFIVSVDKSAAVRDLVAELERLCGIPSAQLLLTDVWQGRIFSTLPDSRPLSKIRDDDMLVCYVMADRFVAPEVMDRLPSEPGDSTDVELFEEGGGTERLMVVVNNTRENPMPFSGGDLVNFSIPVLLSCARRTSTAALRKLLWRAIARFTKTASSDTEEDMVKALPLVVNGKHKLAPNTLLPNDPNLSVADALGLELGAAQLALRWVGRSWDPRVRFDEDAAKTVAVHPSVKAELDASKKERVTLEACLDRFTETEELDHDNKWYCNRCKDHVQATKTLSMWSVPEVLVLGLKRFKHRNLLWMDKVSTYVEFPVRGLDVGPYVVSGGSPQPSTEADREAAAAASAAETKDDDPPATVEVAGAHGPMLYDLYGVVNHTGSIAFGHYYAYVNLAVARGFDDPDGHYWHTFDDSTVRRMSADRVVTRNAYVMFYRKRPESLRPVPGPAAPEASAL